ncbi:MAG: acetate--CoA ligase family protein [Anaerolineae bacterium]|jgi:acetyltransferase
MRCDARALERLFYPRGVAVIGSTSEGKLGYELIRQMLDGGYGSDSSAHRIYAVNPKAQGTLGVSGYESVMRIKAPVDLAVIVSPPATVPTVLDACGEGGVPAAAIITAGFSEVGNQEAEREVVAAAGRNGVRFVGPNCAGIVNTAHRLYPTLETRPPGGSVAVVSQSGAIGGMLLAWAKQYRLGISKFVSYGNGADLNEVDFLRYLADDPATAVVALYIESVADGRRFMAAVQACTRHKPVVVIKAGRTQAGRRATLSHTGSMAGAERVYDAALRQCGAIRVRSVEELFDVCKALVSLPRLAGRRVAVLTNSGGPGVLAADQGEAVGLDLAQPSPAVQDALSQFLPTYCALQNPIDLTVQATGDWYRQALQVLLTEYDGALAINVATPYLDSADLAQGVCAGAGEAARAGGTAKAVAAAFLPEEIVGRTVAYLEDCGVPNFATGERAVAALGLLARYRPGRSTVVQPQSAAAPADADARPLPRAKGMLEPEAMTWLGENGIPVPAFAFAETEQEAVDGARSIGYPLAMKVVSAAVLHKSDVGGVILGVTDDEGVRRAFERLGRIGPRGDWRGVVVYPMVRDALEVLLGLSTDPQFGPVVAFGLGGIYTEVFQDIVLRVAPIDRHQATQMIREIASFPLLEGARGGPQRDLDALADTLTRFSLLPFEHPWVQELDLNPVFLFETGKGLLVGDVRVVSKLNA